MSLWSSLCDANLATQAKSRKFPSLVYTNNTNNFVHNNENKYLFLSFELELKFTDITFYKMHYIIFLNFL